MGSPLDPRAAQSGGPIDEVAARVKDMLRPVGGVHFPAVIEALTPSSVLGSGTV